MIGLEIIKMLVQSLVIIIVLAVFLEMLLPGSQMHAYVKMVMGLLVIVLVLEAGAKLVRQDFQLALPAISQRTALPSAAGIMAEGQKLREQQKQLAAAEYRQGLEKQVLALARLQNRLHVTGVQVKINQQAGNQDFGRLTGIVLEIDRSAAEGKTGIADIEPVKVTWEANSQPETAPGDGLAGSEQARRLAQTVANFYNLPLEQVQVVEKSRQAD
ncbi:stage III sporulation protein AF [Desulforamulus hydrothermalis]|uniref:Sporulation stage III protein AF n=1 Tax=Desulforamulus hydrothermalis Lam5 = DSM 18033 TaxID=1121428 RepID=K8E0F0_9FIRM|nr:stage III sporulation protein AF [Desulforamulus hydrothermalis]CCO08910.1 Sporulation stage III protein AF [Desulforamulus hydrothermalis Lam5 = DSM 18033]SHG74562.1 stage III sporulation protein AF [Desulforamulus hydrothermalis Lam5 = DSM 18033]